MSKVLSLIFRWQKETAQWTMGVQNEIGEDVVTHIPLICGIDGLTADLLRVYAYKMVGCMAIIPLGDEDWGVDPTKTNLATNYDMIWGDSSG